MILIRKKLRVKGDDSFSLAELLGWSISRRRPNVHLLSWSLLPLTVLNFLLRNFLLGSVVDNQSIL